MKVLTTALLAISLPVASAHYSFAHLIVNNTVSSEWQYVRKYAPVPINESAGEGMYGPYIDPIYDYTSLDIRCGRGAFNAGTNTQTATVLAGTEVGFQIGPIDRSTGVGEQIFHLGPGFAWLSKAEGVQLETYEGEGGWVKIAEAVERNKEERKKKPMETRKWDWALYMETSWKFKIPLTTPPGEYLLRIEQIYPTVYTSLTNKGTQWFVNCAHIRVLGPGGGVPGPLVRLPGAYVKNQPEIFFDSDLPDFNMSRYKTPAPAVWRG